MNKDLVAIFEYLEREKGIARSIVVAAIEDSLLVAARKSAHGAADVTVQVNSKTGAIDVFCKKTVVQKVENPNQQISIREYAKIDPDCKIGDIVTVPIIPKDFGRIAAQRARQVIAQKLLEAERDVIYDEYKDKVGDLVSGPVKRVGRGALVIVDLGKVEGILPRTNYPKGENYQVGDRVLSLLEAVRDTENGGAEVLLSRSSEDFVRALLVQEVPELLDETVSIEGIVREAGYRTKIVVSSRDNRVDPVGACIGVRGVRIKNVIREVNNEKIDIFPYSSDKLELLQFALDPIQVKKIIVDEDDETIAIVVGDDDFAATIGKKGLNARLIGRLLDVQLNVYKYTDYQKISELERLELAEEEDETLDEIVGKIDGVPELATDQLAAEKYTIRKLLRSSLEELSQIPGISLELADKILEQIKKQRA